MKSIFFIIIVILSTISSIAGVTENVFQQYLDLKSAIILEESDRAKEIVKAMKGSLKENDDSIELQAIYAAIREVDDNSDLEEIKMAFISVSDHLWNVLYEPGSSIEAYFLFCPMTQKFWIDKKPVIENPYHGFKMVNCGRIVDSVND